MFNAENLQVYLKKDLGVSPQTLTNFLVRKLSKTFDKIPDNVTASIFAVP